MAADPQGRAERSGAPLRLQGIVLPAWSVRALSALLITGAIGLPWIATWQGALRYEPSDRKAPAPEVVQIRPELVELPGGSFLMGSPAGEKDRYKAGQLIGVDEIDDNEQQHPAEVSSFAICRTEVTLAQWRAVMGTRPNNCSYGCEGEHPVEGISWEDAIRYLNRLTDTENNARSVGERMTRCYEEGTWSWDRACTGYRLPTEAEWEYAARAGTQTVFSFGDDAKALCTYANVADQATKRERPEWAVTMAECDDGYAYLAPVGKRTANPWGLFDMHGNVAEWTWDLSAKALEGSDSGYVAPKTGTTRVMRGGGFSYGPAGNRSASRVGLNPSQRTRIVGLRCARGALPKP